MINPVFILAGGLGTRIRDYSDAIPKPMVPIGGKPILWHIMKKYSRHGFNNFVICTGYKAEVISQYFLNYSTVNSDFTVYADSGRIEVHPDSAREPWRVTVAYTGEQANTGARVARAARRYLDASSKYFGVTYGDGLTDANLMDSLEFHEKNGHIGTAMGVHVPSRWGEFELDGNVATYFNEKPNLDDKWINGGYMWFRPEALNYMSSEEDFALEGGLLYDLAQDEELTVFKHEGFWKCMDTQRERDELEKLWNEKRAPWRNW